MCPYRFQRNGQPKPRAASGLLRRKKRLKNLCELLGIHTAAGIGEFDGDQRSVVWRSQRGMRTNPHDQGSSSRHGAERVLDQIVEYFLELLGIGVDFLDPVTGFGDHRDLPPLELRPEERDTFFDARTQIEWRSNRFRLPGIQQHVLNDFRCSFDLGLHSR
jgi:hypothetical protein